MKLSRDYARKLEKPAYTRVLAPRKTERKVAYRPTFHDVVFKSKRT